MSQPPGITSPPSRRTLFSLRMEGRTARSDDQTDSETFTRWGSPPDAVVRNGGGGVLHRERRVGRICRSFKPRGGGSTYVDFHLFRILPAAHARHCRF